MAQGKVAFITGGTSGIGLGLAGRFAAAGYALGLNGLEANGADIAADLGRQHGVPTWFSAVDLAAPSGIPPMIAAAEAALGRIDVLVNNAGIQHVSPIESFPEEKWDRILAINLSAAFHLCKAVWPGMKARGFGRIVNIASVHGIRASEFKVAYIAAKHGLLGLTKTLALEGAPCNITVNAICPGYVRTPLVDMQIADQAQAHGLSERDVIANVLLKKQAVKEFVPVDALADLALLLAGDEARLFTGAEIPVDGGWSAQ